MISDSLEMKKKKKRLGGGGGGRGEGKHSHPDPAGEKKRREGEKGEGKKGCCSHICQEKRVPHEEKSKKSGEKEGGYISSSKIKLFEMEDHGVLNIKRKTSS